MNNDDLAEESDWTPENVHKLFSQMKDNIPTKVLTCSYSRGLKHVDWNKVAFPPFSAEACQQKWKQHLDKMRKVRSLTELITEAEHVVSDPLMNVKSHPDFPKRPPCPAAMFCAEKCTQVKQQNPEVAKNRDALRAMSRLYSELSENKKAKYSQKYQLAFQEYMEKKKEFRQKLRTRLSKTKKAASNKMDGLPPRPPPNGYMLFCKENPIAPSDSPCGGNVKNWAQGWRVLTQTEKTTYNKHADEMKREYTTKLKEYLGTLEEKEQEKLLVSNAMYISKEVLMRGTLKEPEMPSDALEEIRPDKSLKTNKSLRKYSLDLQKWFKTLTAAEQKEYRKSNPSKCIYLKLPQIKSESEEVCLQKTSDSSEDEDHEDSNSGEDEGEYPDWNEEVEENEDDAADNTFDFS